VSQQGVGGLIDSHPLDDDQARSQLREKNRVGLFGPFGLMRRIRTVLETDSRRINPHSARGESSDVIDGGLGADHPRPWPAERRTATVVDLPGRLRGRGRTRDPGFLIYQRQKWI
jgi:hypothetical protein